MMMMMMMMMMMPACIHTHSALTHSHSINQGTKCHCIALHCSLLRKWYRRKGIVRMIKITSFALLVLSFSLLCCNAWKMNAGRSQNANIPKKIAKALTTIGVSSILGFSGGQPDVSKALAVGGVVLGGEVTIKEGYEVPAASTAALYITAREDIGLLRSAVLNSKPPPILTKRIPIKASNFPYQFKLDSQFDLTPEGQQTYAEWSSGKTPILISARVDEDGVAATRGPNDLVGKGTSNYGLGEGDPVWDKTAIELVGRGVTGKFLTGNGQPPNVPSD